MHYYKYSGTGNDFIFFNQIDKKIELTAKMIQELCDRRTGIGADGIVLIRNSIDFDFEMIIYNADGSNPEMCGNAGRCALHFARNVLGVENRKMKFKTMNSVYEGEVLSEEVVKLKMSELSQIDLHKTSDFGDATTFFCNTGVPHTVIEVSSVDAIDICERGARVRNDKRFAKGTNVDFFEVLDAPRQKIKLRIFERGVEGETLCCGTGVVATAVCCAHRFGWRGKIAFETKGGEVLVELDRNLEEIYYQGEVEQLLSGDIEL